MEAAFELALAREWLDPDPFGEQGEMIPCGEQDLRELSDPAVKTLMSLADAIDDALDVLEPE